MTTLNDFQLKQRKYMPVFPKASRKPTVYIEGYPCEDDEPMAATGFHADQISSFSEQLLRYFAINPHIYIGIDNFIYYREDDITKFVAPDIYVVLGVDKYPQRRSFYTWSEGAVPTTIFEFLSDATANQDRHEKSPTLSDRDGCSRVLHPSTDMERPIEFRGWRQNAAGNIVEIVPDAQGGLFSEALNLYFRWEDQLHSHVRLLRPYLPDGTPDYNFYGRTSPPGGSRRTARTKQRHSQQQKHNDERTLKHSQQQKHNDERDAELELERLRAQLANT